MAHDYDVLVLGGGAAGLTAAGVAVNLGASAMMVERDRLGGDCTWTGCIPSKTLLRAAEVAHQAATASHYGLPDTPIRPDFGALMRHVRGVREHVYEDADAPPIFEAMGVAVRHGRARFVDAHTVEIEGEGGTGRVSGRYVVIATGGRPAVPPVPGLDGVPFLTTESLFEIEDRPAHLGILGGGPIGVEMAQAFRRLGSDVTVLDRGPRILSKDDPDLAGILQERLAAEGVRFVMNAEAEHVERDPSTGSGQAGERIALTVKGASERLVVDALLVAAGRRPNVEGLGLDAAGIDFTQKGITVDAYGRTNVKHVYAVGDVAGQFAFTHMSEHTAKVAVTHALLKLPMKVDAAHLPWVTYTDPELAHVGRTAAQLEKDGTAFETYRFPYDRLDRAITEGAAVGEIRVYATRWRGKILGATVLGGRAGELIGELALAMRHGVSLREISDTIHPYPTYGLGVRRVADQWYARRQSARLTRLVQRVFGYRGPVHEHEPGRIV